MKLFAVEYMKNININQTDITKNFLNTNKGAGGWHGIVIAVLLVKPVNLIFQVNAEVEQSTLPQLVTMPLNVLKATGT